MREYRIYHNELLFETVTAEYTILMSGVIQFIVENEAVAFAPLDKIVIRVK